MRLKKRAWLIAAVFLMAVLAASLYGQMKRANAKVSITIPVQFTPSYRQDRQNAISVEIPEVYELLHIVTALSEAEDQAPAFTNRQTPYYQDVISHFSKYQDHPAVSRIKTANEKLGYSNVRNLFIYGFREDQIVAGGTCASDYINERYGTLFLKELQDFAKASGFRQFYKEHGALYRQHAALVRAMPVQRMWNWLERQFPQHYDSYKIILSPLTGGSHNTFHYEDTNNDFDEIVLFVSSPAILSMEKYPSGPVREGLVSQMLFTEIDHNYVNPMSNRYIHLVTGAFKDLLKWKDKPGYDRAALTFNEYMTWGTFLLYAHDAYDTDSFKQIEQATVDTMNRRGFRLFGRFHKSLWELYEGREAGETVADLYPDILKWCAEAGA